VLLSTSLSASIAVSVTYGSYVGMGTMSFGNIDTVTVGYGEFGSDIFTPLHSTDVTDGPFGTRLALGFYQDNDFAFSFYFAETPVLQVQRGWQMGYIQSLEWGPIALATAPSPPSQSTIVHSGTDTSSLLLWGGGLWVFGTNSLGGLDVGFIPEPSTYALIFGGLALAFVALRRK
jgi:hypothetical protein